MAKLIKLSELSATLDGYITQYTQNLIAESGKRVVDKTPADTGWLKGNTGVEVDGTRYVNAQLDPSGSATITNINKIADQITPFNSIKIFNQAVYAYDVEVGTSENRPVGFMLRTANEIQVISDLAAKRVKE